jgi:hypothetical protein
MDKLKEAQDKYRPDVIKVLFVGESPPVSGKYFYCGNNSLLNEMRRALGRNHDTDEDFLINFRDCGWYLDDLVQNPVSERTELKNKCRAAVDDLATRIRCYKPSIVVCLLRRIRDHVETAVLKADSDACVYAVSFPPQQPRRFREEMRLLRPRLKRLP